MSYEDHAAGVAEDYRDALDGLTMNSRVEISNLTLIARENTEFAHAIADTLQDHIMKATPPRKLPALYLLDSIVKNVGTPYTLFFGRKLYQTFMEAYASVDNGTRRKMDEMLKTWKEPVPGSIDTRPVFPPDVVRPIENALIKARTSALQAQQEHIRKEQQLLNRGRPQQAPYRETPTPPGGGRSAPPPNISYGQPPFPGMNGAQYPDPTLQVYPMHPVSPEPCYEPQLEPSSLTSSKAQQYARSTPQPPPSAPAAVPFQPPPSVAAPAYGAAPAVPVAGGVSNGSLSRDIEQLITACKAEFAQNVHDASIQTRLKALLDLQGILQGQHLPPDQLMLVKTRVDELSVEMKGRKPAAGAGGGGYTPTPPVAVPPYQPPPATAPPPTTAAASGVSLDALFGRGALATLLARNSATPQAATPFPPPPPAAAPPPSAVPAAIQSPALQLATPQPVGAPFAPPPAAAAPAAAPPASADPMALLGILRKAGMLANLPGGAVPPPPAPPAVATAAAPTPTISSLFPGLAGVMAAQQARPGGGGGGGGVSLDPLDDIVLEAASLKKFRPHLIPLLYQDLGPPCTQCGRRFRTDEQGRARKTAHMDWHFRIHQRIVEAEKRGQHRSWYVDEGDWARSREGADGEDGREREHGHGHDHDHDQRQHGADADRRAAGAGGKQLQWIPVPAGAGAGSTGVCPICQERFEMKWLDEAQEWVWMDAVRLGGRVYHASCHAEATRGVPEPQQQPQQQQQQQQQQGKASSSKGARPHHRGGGGGKKRKAEDNHHAWRGKVKGAAGKQEEAKVDLNDLPY